MEADAASRDTHPTTSARIAPTIESRANTACKASCTRAYTGNPRPRARIQIGGEFVVKPPKVSNDPAEVVCTRCHHTESEHGKTGSRPCIAMVGDLVTREFCKCDSFQAPASVRKAA